MEDINIINIVLGIIGTITGCTGSLLGILNFFRDKSNIQIELQWDMRHTSDAEKSAYDAEKLYGVIFVVNLGRRPVFVSHAAIKLPGKGKYLFPSENAVGVQLKEGDPPIRYPLEQSIMKEYAKDWKKICAEITDSTGKKYYSKPSKIKPIWAEII